MLVRILNNFLSKLKGDDYSIDSRIPFLYLFGLLLKRSRMYLKGKLSMISNKGMLFIGSGTRIRGTKLISFGRGVTIDDGSLIDALSYDGVRFGDNVSLGKRSVIECSGSLKQLGKGIIVSSNVGLGRDCFYGCAGGIEIGSDTIIGNFVSFHSENHNIDSGALIRLQGVSHKGIKIGRDCWIGAKVTILDGVVLNDGCIIAAGAVLTAGLYSAYSIYGGVPAKKIGERR